MSQCPGFDATVADADVTVVDADVTVADADVTVADADVTVAYLNWNVRLNTVIITVKLFDHNSTIVNLIVTVTVVNLFTLINTTLRWLTLADTTDVGFDHRNHWHISQDRHEVRCHTQHAAARTTNGSGTVTL
jgi:hypothetical protein